MSLYGALFSGVSGLTAQSSAMGAISDNITNVSTIGYKGTTVNFQTLVTKQTSSTFYSAGGVQSKPRQQTDVQGLLQASTSQTDIAVSGGGFFVVNQASNPGVSDPYLFTRAGSFIQDDEGYLKNVQGYYLQGWPTDAAGVVKPANSSLTITNQNIISTDYVESINLNRVGGTAAATSNVAIGANLPASGTDSEAGDTHKTDVEFFDSLGTANNMSVVYTKSTVPNQWDVSIAPPPGTSVATLYDGASTPLVYESNGLLEFTAIPSATSTLTINSTTYTFTTGATAGVNISTAAGRTLTQVVADLVARVEANDPTFAVPTAALSSRIKVKDGVTTAVEFRENGVGNITVNPASLLSSTGAAVTKQTSSFTVQQQDNTYSDFTLFKFPSVPANGTSIVIRGTTYTFQSGEAADATGANTIVSTAGGTVASMLADLEAAIEGQDTTLAVTGNRVRTLAVGGATVDTLYLETVNNVTNTVDTTALGITLTDGDGTAHGTTTSVSTTKGMIFDAGGVPSAFNAVSLEILGYANGAQNMSNAAGEGSRVTLDFGTVGESNGMVQFGAQFVPDFITQNGSKFGTFAGVTIGQDGLVTALFDNGETRKIFQIPMATFVNPNQLENKSGNVWSATQASGDYTLRVADSGPAGQVVQSALEASTVDIGAEFTNMIVVQRAYSASTKIITTADQMLEELMRTK
ncbi:flagellar hook-basal body complex protein [Magnetovibrio sp.]|uniref:flagellar hook-basal body complex protein n=1 Tax=Magnetovibrio sp. TaxID=2024836 RepID=UPI002F947BB7